jgi:hypothetical protein
MNCQNVRSAIDIATRRAPVDESIKAHLSGCRDCRNHSDQTSALLALLNAQPRVEAPADFNFKLRARIASAEAEARTPWAAFERFWARSFSWGQALTATATLALLATFTALHFTSSNRPAVTAPERMASANVAVTTQKPDPVAPESVRETTSVREAVISEAKPTTVKLSARSARVSPASFKSVEVTTPKVQVAGGGDEPWRGYNSEKGKFVSAPTRDLIGAEGQNSRMAKTAAFVPSI